ncbi:hypothetical protein KIW84_064124 [Lathyrus oleraceus]|uniref:Uncharacterized protein n=1 Tax=Pisum sativum TaxID=3888 RepID=A0A9D5A5R2_PEA|nr:hypothetical protein KIW84_064124 [Pisum sativum]
MLRHFLENGVHIDDCESSSGDWGSNRRMGFIIWQTGERGSNAVIRGSFAQEKISGSTFFFKIVSSPILTGVNYYPIRVQIVRLFLVLLVAQFLVNFCFALLKQLALRKSPSSKAIGGRTWIPSSTTDVRGANTFPLRNRLPYPFSLVARPFPFQDATLSHVLVDTVSSLNVLPKKALAKLDCEGLILTPTDLIVRAFDGSKRAVFGEVELPVKIGPEVFKSVFYVMDIQPAYSCLLGRPWIHAAGAVTSTLHQKLKYIWDRQVVTVCGEEDIFVSHLSSFKYVEMDGEIWETPSQAFETVRVENAIFAKGEKSSISSYKQAAEVVKNGEAPGWGKMMDITARKIDLGLVISRAEARLGRTRVVAKTSRSPVLECWIQIASVRWVKRSTVTVSLISG